MHTHIHTPRTRVPMPSPTCRIPTLMKAYECPHAHTGTHTENLGCTDPRVPRGPGLRRTGVEETDNTTVGPTTRTRRGRGGSWGMGCDPNRPQERPSLRNPLQEGPRPRDRGNRGDINGSQSQKTRQWVPGSCSSSYPPFFSFVKLP